MKKKLLFFILFSGLLLSQSRDSLIFKSHKQLSYSPMVVPAALMSAGAVVLTTEKRQTTFADHQLLGFGGYLEDYAQFSPHLALYGFHWAGMKSKTDLNNQTAILVKSQLLVLGSSLLLKHIFKEPRPDGSNRYGFPSGHTATAFSGAELLSTEYKKEYPWVPYLAYGVATGVGVLRVKHEKHYWSDVIFGAGLGILSTKLAYWTHHYKWHKKSEKDQLSLLYKNHL